MSFLICFDELVEVSFIYFELGEEVCEYEVWLDILSWVEIPDLSSEIRVLDERTISIGNTITTNKRINTSKKQS